MSINHIIETVDKLPKISQMETPKKNNSIRNPETANHNSPISTSDESGSEEDQIQLILLQFSQLFVNHLLIFKISRHMI